MCLLNDYRSALQVECTRDMLLSTSMHQIEYRRRSHRFLRPYAYLQACQLCSSFESRTRKLTRGVTVSLAIVDNVLRSSSDIATGQMFQ